MRVHMYYIGCTEKHKYTFTEKKIFMIAFLLYLHLFPCSTALNWRREYEDDGEEENKRVLFY